MEIAFAGTSACIAIDTSSGQGVLAQLHEQRTCAGETHRLRWKLTVKEKRCDWSASQREGVAIDSGVVR